MHLGIVKETPPQKEISLSDIRII